MEIIIGKNAGFCFGVKNAVDKVTQKIQECGEIYCLGELVHNKEVTEELIKNGVKFIDKIEDAKGAVVIRAHGVPSEVYDKAKDLNLKIEDLTCPKVLYIHNIVKKFRNENYYIFLVGQKEHPETIGTISFCGKNSFIIENPQDIHKAISSFYKSGLTKALVISQTTFSLEKFKNIVEIIQENIKNLEIKNTICNATKQRQEETAEIAKKVDMMIIIGGKHSSNSNKLYEIAKENCNKVIFVENKDDLDVNFIKNINNIGIMAGASTPSKSIDEIVDIIKQI